MTYGMTIAGLKRELPLCPISDELQIGAFVIFGDVELTVAAAAELLKKAPDFDYMVAPEAKAIPLIHEIDDVISTGESLRALEQLVTEAGGIICGRMAILAEGEAADRDDIIYLEKLPLFDKNGNPVA